MRIVTRPDFDGLVCAVLLYDVEDIDQPVKWIQPSDVQRGVAEIRSGDILANLPYDDRCSLWFDHHYTNRIDRPFSGAFHIAPSAAGVIFKHYREGFRRDFSDLVDAADKIDSAALSMDEALHPENYPYVTLSMTITDKEDPSEERYWNKLIDLFGKMEIDDVLKDGDVQHRCRQVAEQNRSFKGLLKQYTSLEDHVSITDFRPLHNPPEGNRFLVYSMFPEAVVSIKIRFADGDRETVRVSIGHSIFNQNCRINVGLMLSAFEGGGHRAAGGCSFAAEKADDYLPQMVDLLLKNEPNEP